MSPYEADSPPVGGGSSQERTWAMGCHLAAFGKYSPVPFGGLIGPLIAWQMKKEEFPLVDDQGKEALNFQIGVLAMQMMAGGMMFVGMVVIPLFFVGLALLILISIADFILTIIAALQANKGVAYRYPFSLRIVK